MIKSSTETLLLLLLNFKLAFFKLTHHLLNLKKELHKAYYSLFEYTSLSFIRILFTSCTVLYLDTILGTPFFQS